MYEAKPIKPKSRYIYIVNEVLTLESKGVSLFVIPTNRQHFATTTLNGDNVWTSNPIVVIDTLNNEVSVDLIDSVAVIISQRVPAVLRFFLFYVGVKRFRFSKVNISVEPTSLQLLQIVLCLTHNVRNTLCSFDI